MAWSSWSGNPALFAAFMAVLCGVGLLVSYFGEQQDLCSRSLGRRP